MIPNCPHGELISMICHECEEESSRAQAKTLPPEPDLAPDVRQLFERAQVVFADRAKRYGTNNIAEAGLAGVLARMRDKLARAENLLDEGTPEMLIDTALDFANYGIIAASLAQGSWPQERKSVLVQTDNPDSAVHLNTPQHDGDVGYDLRTSKRMVVRLGEPCYIPTGVRLCMPHNTWCTIVGRSSLLRERACMVPPCVIDTGYTGYLEICVVALGAQVIIPAGERIAQVIFHKSVTPRLEEVGDLPETARGMAGFGSTGRD